jgi:hypothetical protein
MMPTKPKINEDDVNKEREEIVRLAESEDQRTRETATSNRLMRTEETGRKGRHNSSLEEEESVEETEPLNNQTMREKET